MTDLTWVEKTQSVEEDDPAKQAFENNPGWHLLYITGGWQGPIKYVYGWGDKPSEEIYDEDSRSLYNNDPISRRHIEHYRYCECLGDSSICCDKACSCQSRIN